MLAVVGVAAVAETYLAEDLGWQILAGAQSQVALGAWLGTAWVAEVTVAYAPARRSALIAISPSLADGTMRTAGHSWRQTLSLAAQSALGEEAVFRLLGVAVLTWGFTAVLVVHFVYNGVTMAAPLLSHRRVDAAQRPDVERIGIREPVWTAGR